MSPTVTAHRTTHARPLRAAAPDTCPAGHEALEFGHRLCRGLSGRPSDDRVCRDLVLALPTHLGAGAALLGQVRDDGDLHVTGQFGYPDAKSFPGPFPMGDDWPLVRTLRSPHVLALATSDDVAREFPLMANRYARPRPFAGTQLEFNGSAIGVAVVSFNAPVEDVDSVSILMRIVRDIVGLYVGMTWQEQSVDVTPVSAAPRYRRADDEPLTPRQLTILFLLAEGMSNPQIAFRIGYSESTVRQESMAIYRALGVSDRRAAVQVALSRGILADDTIVGAAAAE